MFPNTPHRNRRRSIRLPGYDYAQPGAYFVTICTHERRHLFGRIADGAVHLSRLGETIQSEWLACGNATGGIELDEFIVMPNHIHAILVLTIDRATGCVAGIEHTGRATRWVAPTERRPRGPAAGSVGAMIGQFKSRATKRVLREGDLARSPLWQRNYYEHVIRSDEALHAIRTYIENNVVLWDYDYDNSRRIELRRELLGGCLKPLGFSDQGLKLILDYEIAYRAHTNHPRIHGRL
jgi:REP element-mobilizing transposase RayT